MSTESVGKLKTALLQTQQNIIRMKGFRHVRTFLHANLEILPTRTFIKPIKLRLTGKVELFPAE